MTRRAFAAALLAVLAGAALSADLGAGKTTYVSWTVSGLKKRTPGKLTTWNLKALSFAPDGRGVKPFAIDYKSIRALEYGRRPGRQRSPEEPVFFADTPHDLADAPHYLTIVYAAPELKKEPEKKDKEKPEELTLEQEREKQRKDRDQEQEKAQAKKPDAVAVFQLGDGILKETLRILESRSGKRIRYQDAAARRSAR